MEIQVVRNPECALTWVRGPSNLHPEGGNDVLGGV